MNDITTSERLCTKEEAIYLNYRFSDIVNIVGVGRVSSSIAHALFGKVEFGYVISRDIEKAKKLSKEINAVPKTYDDEFLLNGTVLLGLNDSTLPRAEELLSGKIGDITALHFSGFLTSDIFPSDWSPASMHPNCAVSSEWQDFKDIIFGIEGTKKGTEIAKDLITLLGGTFVEISKEEKPLYHLAAVIVSNFSVALSYLSSSIYKDIGFSDEQSRKIISTLLKSVSENISEKKLSDALTGPVKRGDWEVVEKEALIFKSKYPEYEKLYWMLVDILKKLE
ncbi:DUF2520 domain-containing protein [Fervidobacterium riparium]|uniref:Predicted oxidoreductase, contains short-chain dehydrogenase (SDR) and DUF2520 domains n=1 Tax=Fervidobacterium gondwanense DSM 13020 TaxID=1121883 RepID=A0A1M7SPS4_FERGO|nr:Rossmann-like and DUF2520 domain-containing protein [Fervidobacterium gondwanense]SHN60533.1 Predicted oxidoreductase, contains short-chain dehydrogenase (SDR) and DUF2520 domains [Fervidobacterium gondwanense DSM 13020]